MQAFLEENELQTPISIINEISEHLKQLKNSFNKYFPTDRKVFLKDREWVVNPFSVCGKPSSLSSIEYESLIDITSDSTFQSTFSSNSYVEFWLNLKNTSFDNLSQKAITILLPFATTYLCETGFSAYAATKTKYRNRLNVELDLRIQLSKIEPDIAKLSKNKQPKNSHYF
ncbi:zinc finger BED domain-containing protein 5-like [Daktulosphaira vitifoliae]|uniref:zinc finger BED domain-containing protein 5-like n=1 Tax=Daktulosphaira vitifoliae TaxID=58002 RepID=UPI0021AA5D61|nr:zinc finger BED domain-containing protein 5-like [Daktulosphaira vitifoliae]